jgi:hypothetical protein
MPCLMGKFLLAVQGQKMTIFAESSLFLGPFFIPTGLSEVGL